MNSSDIPLRLSRLKPNKKISPTYPLVVVESNALPGCYSITNHFSSLNFFRLYYLIEVREYFNSLDPDILVKIPQFVHTDLSVWLVIVRSNNVQYIDHTDLSVWLVIVQYNIFRSILSTILHVFLFLCSCIPQSTSSCCFFCVFSLHEQIVMEFKHSPQYLSNNCVRINLCVQGS